MVNYVTNVYMHNPHLLASKTTTWFGERTGTMRPADLPFLVGRTQPVFVGMIVSHTADVESENGIEKAPPPSVPPARQAGALPQGSNGPILSFILAQAVDGGRLAWLRWESIDGKPAAVFSFAVDKTKSRYQVNYCCFPIFNKREISPGSLRIRENFAGVQGRRPLPRSFLR